MTTKEHDFTIDYTNDYTNDYTIIDTTANRLEVPFKYMYQHVLYVNVNNQIS